MKDKIKFTFFFREEKGRVYRKEGKNIEYYHAGYRRWLISCILVCDFKDSLDCAWMRKITKEEAAFLT